MNGFANTESFVLADAHKVILAEDGAVFKDFLKNTTGGNGDLVKGIASRLF